MLEKPSVPTVVELEAMQDEVAATVVEVLMRYNKNVCKYVKRTRGFAEGVEGGTI